MVLSSLQTTLGQDFQRDASFLLLDKNQTWIREKLQKVNKTFSTSNTRPQTVLPNQHPSQVMELYSFPSGQQFL